VMVSIFAVRVSTIVLLTMFLVPVFPQGDPTDNKELQELIEKAEQGDADAQYNLGVMYDDGRGVSLDYVQAHMWLSLAASRLTGEDRARAVEYRDRVTGKMTLEQIDEAQRLAREFKPKSSGSQ